MRDLTDHRCGRARSSPALGDWPTTVGTRTWHGTGPITLADHIRIGSYTKPMTGTEILQSVDEGKIRLDDPVSQYRPDVSGMSAHDTVDDAGKMTQTSSPHPAMAYQQPRVPDRRQE